MDIIKKMNQTEKEKALLLTQVAELYKNMADIENEKMFFNISGQISVIMITCCLLAKRYGINCNVIKKMIDKQIRLYLCDENSSDELVSDLQEVRELFVHDD